jgi:hypothetical protein
MKQVMRDDLARRYRQFLDYVARSVGLELKAEPAAFVTPMIVDGYIAELHGRVGSVTLYGNVYKLRRAAELLSPAKDLSWLKEIEQDLEWGHAAGLQARSNCRFRPHRQGGSRSHA